MYLGKFFHRPPGDDDRELLLILGGDPMIIGIYMREGQDGSDEFLRETYSDAIVAISAFRREAAKLVDAGYFETSHTKYTLRNLLPDPQKKPDWQKGMDELMMAALSAPLAEQAKHLKTLKGTPAEHEPLYLWLAAHHGLAADADAQQTLRFAERARDTLAARRAAKQPHYAWSIYDSQLEGRILESLSDAFVRVGNPSAGLAAIERACRVAANHARILQRAVILCVYFPERAEDAFDDAYRWSRYGGYEDIMALPGYAAYEAGRKAGANGQWRWKAAEAAREEEVRKAEAELGLQLPDDYRKFLLTRGETELLVRLPEHSAELRFHRPADLATERNNILDFVSFSDAERLEKAVIHFREEYGVSLRHLLPVAEPAQASRCLLLHLEPGERYGWCYRWDHDGAWELETPAPSFDAALAALTGGIEQRDKPTLGFLNIYLD
ncbi:SMI1/KNR4 family protein [Bradyrhizobium sp. CCGUVB1N3]|uniref:SMI1/KNR4 family protein n=1 Tax=Bradyrhizobium sp. CCGUVB1N3 TaxID=2949629 RepID=UPI0020B34A42|nr:SMI1/KNR4 family protein [Bradyrhizobium sp. CCGUVB1N3]MCP3474368.1 SMI1/KNR4 family protein [Bradyrhizobium sp. CCGUVB1N3]